MSSGCVNAEYINVFVRVRAPILHEHNTKSSINIVDNKKRIRISSNQNKEFEFEHVFDSNSTQSDVFDLASIPVIKEVFNRYDCTIITYGLSDTGKTYTLLGSGDANEDTLGIIQKSCAYIFNNIERFKKKAVVRVSCLGLINEELVDMLSDNIDTSSMLKMHEDQYRKGSVLVDGLKELTVFNIEDVHRIIKQVLIKKQKMAKLHMIFTIMVRVRETSFNGEEFIKNGKLTFIDLSFSDNNGSKDNNYNMSLFTLRNVITAVSEKHSYVPYRNSKLTRLLQKSIGGSSKTTMIASISEAPTYLEGTMNTLEFARKVKLIQNYPRVYQLIPGNIFMNRYTDEILKLKKDIEASRMGVGINISEENYNSMMTNINSLERQLFEKIVLSRDAEEELEAKKQEFIRIENKLKKTIKVNEGLLSDVQILNTHYGIALQKKDEQQQQFQQIINNYNNLICSNKALVSETKANLTVEEEMHRKMSSLYECFKKCRTAFRDFRPTFEIGNLSINNDIENCIKSVRESLKNNSDKLQHLNSELETTNPDLKYDLDKLNTLCSHVLEYVVDYESLRKLYTGKEKDCMENFMKDFVDSLDVIYSTMYRNNNECIHRLNEKLKSNEASWTQMCTTLLRTFKDIKFMAGNYVDDLHENVNQIQETMLNNKHAEQEQIEEVTRQHFREIISIVETKKILTQELQNDFNEILIDIQDYEEYCNSICNDVEDKNIVEKLRKSQRDLFESSCKSMEEIRRVSKQCVNSKHEEISQYSKSLSAFESQEDSLLQNEKLEVEKILEQNCQRFADVLTDSKLLWSNFQSSFIEREEAENQHFSKVDDVCENIRVLCLPINETCDSLCNCVETVYNTFKNDVDDACMKLQKMEAGYYQYDSQAVKLVNKFGRQELQHPHHAGDTPRRSQKLCLNISGIKILNTVNSEE